MSIFTWFWDNVTKPMDDKRIKTLRVPTLNETVDVAYLDDSHEHHLLDVYSPFESDGVLPTIIDVHGGGWYYGDKDLNKIYCLNLVERGFKVVNISYRLAPKASLKDQVQDIVSALNYIVAHANQYNIDLNNLFITGDSAGAHLTSLIINLINDSDMQQAYAVQTDIKFKAVAYTCAIFDISKLSTMPIVKSYFTPLFEKKGTKCDIYKYSSHRTDCTGGIPSLYITADGDFLKGQTIKGYETHKSLGYDAELVYFPKDSQTNQLAHVYNVIQPDWEESKIANDKTAEFFLKYIS